MNPSSISSSENWRQARALLLRTALFMAPVLVVMGAFETYLWTSGESWGMERVHDAQAAQPESLYQRHAFPGDLRRYTWTAVQRHRPRVIALGSSTSMEVRREIFGAAGDGFYNAGGLVHQSEHLVEVGDRLAELDHLEVVILGLDPWWFNPSWTGKTFASLEQMESTPEPVHRWQMHLRAYRRLVSIWFEEPGLVLAAHRQESPVDGEFAIGLGAAQGDGFRADGSYQYGQHRIDSRKALVEADVSRVLGLIEERSERFSAANTPSPERIAHLVTFLEAADEAGIVVCASTAPLDGRVVDAMNDSPYHAGYLQGFRDTMAAIFDPRGGCFIDATDPRAWGDHYDGTWWIDGFHGSETLHTEIVYRLLLHDRLRAALPGADPHAIRRLLDDPETTPAELNL